MGLASYLIIFIILNSSRSNSTPNNNIDPIKFSGKYEVISYAKFKNSKISFKVKEWSYEEKIILIKVENFKANYFDVGDVLNIKGELKLTDLKNDYFFSQHINGVINNPEIKIDRKGNGPLTYLSRFHYKILSEINKNYHGQVADLLSGLLIGVDTEFSDDLEESFKITNTNHIIAVSGFNLNLLAEFLTIFLVVLPRKKLSILIFLVLIIFYCIVGFDNIPCLRALLMHGLRSCALFLGRRSSYLNIWGMALFIILMIDPALVFSISLKLSFLATLGLIFLESIYNKLDLVIENWVLSSALVTFFCSIGILPVSIYLGSGLTIKGILANVLVVPIIPLVMVSGMISVIFSMLKMPFLILIIRFTDALLQLLLLIIDASAKL